MKDLRYLLLVIGLVIFAHITKTRNEKTQAKFLPDLQDVKEQKLDDSGRIQVMAPSNIYPTAYRFGHSL